MREPSRRWPVGLGRTTAAAVLVAAAALLTAFLVEAAPGSPAASSCRWRRAAPSRLSSAVDVTSVAAQSASNVWLVGFAYRSSADDAPGTWHWNGRRWLGAGVKGLTARVAPLISVASSGRDAWAVGRKGSNGALTLRSNARFRDRFGYTWWAQVPVPRALGRAGLNSVAMVSRRDVWAVGDGIVLRWRGTWSRVPTPPFVAGWSGLYVTRIVGTNGVWITGYDQDSDQWHAARWTGSGWADSTVAPGLIHARPGLNIAAVSTSNAWIVGRSLDRKGRALVFHWDGSSWSAVAGLPLPTGVASELSGVTARTASDVWAVGSYRLSTGATRSLMLHWNGTHWSRLTAPGTGLSEVAIVPGSRQAWAVGGSYLGKRLILNNVIRYRC
jgi:hypothetical protein